MRKIRVLIVDDSLTVRKRLSGVLANETAFEVVAEARDGSEAIALCQQHRPDVVTMDMMMPVMTGLGATEYIMAHCPTPILVVSSSFNRGEVFKTYDALAAGAVDVIEKPTGSEPEGVWEALFLSALRIVSRVRVITHIRARLDPYSLAEAGAISAANTPGPREMIPAVTGNAPKLIVIGVSTGGPGALGSLLRALPREFKVPVLIVLHIGASFAAPFADWLSAQCARPVAYAKDGELIERLSGVVRLAPVNHHLIVERGRVRLSNAPERHSCRPSVDVLFESVAQAMGEEAVGCLLTGMGRDGAAGLLAMRRRGAITIAQDEASCVVFGMPREAIALNAALKVLPLEQIAPALVKLAMAQGGHG